MSVLKEGLAPMSFGNIYNGKSRRRGFLVFLLDSVVRPAGMGIEGTTRASARGGQPTPL